MLFSSQQNELLAKGRYSEIYRYLDTDSLELFIIKKHPLMCFGFKKEWNIRKLEAFSKIYEDPNFLHPNIIKFYGYEEDQEDGYFKLEYINGYDLNRIINESKSNKAEKHVNEDTILFYILEIIKGLEFLHSKGIYHCDLKPENIVISKNVVKIVDFGSCIISKKKVINVKSEEFLGTAGYLPPQIADYSYKGDIDLEHVDLFGLGATIYFCYTKRKPFIGDSLSETLHNVKKMYFDLDYIQNENIKDIVKKIFYQEKGYNLQKVTEALVEHKKML